MSNRCDECGRMRNGVDRFAYPGGSLADLCPRCADDCGFDPVTRELRDTNYSFPDISWDDINDGGSESD